MTQCRPMLTLWPTCTRLSILVPSPITVSRMRAAVDRGAGADLDVILNDHAADLRHLEWPVPARHEAEAILPDAAAGMHDHPVADQRVAGLCSRRRSRSRGRSARRRRSPHWRRSRCRSRSRRRLRSPRRDRSSRPPPAARRDRYARLRREPAGASEDGRKLPETSRARLRRRRDTARRRSAARRATAVRRQVPRW